MLSLDWLILAAAAAASAEVVFAGVARVWCCWQISPEKRSQKERERESLALKVNGTTTSEASYGGKGGNKKQEIFQT